MAQPRRITKQSKQTGGTLFGVVLGLIVGLAIAVVVAIFITRTPTPFVTKAPPTTPAIPASEAYDPNRMLQGKTPGVPVTATAQSASGTAGASNAASGTPPILAANPSSAAPGGLAVDPQIVEISPGTSADASDDGDAASAVPPLLAASAPKPVARTVPKKPTPPVRTANTERQDAARVAAAASAASAARAAANAERAASAARATNAARTANAASATRATSTASRASGAEHTASAQTPKPAAGDAGTGYFLQVGAYKSSSDAEQQRARLAFQGVESRVTQHDANDVTYYRVRVGPFSKSDDADSARQRLSEAGINATLIRFSKQ